ncbi:MAG: class I SAM-dependent methyltransferase, partial [Butyrivibrio sp.]|nr:class I SAM-dependent methyltransferase [Butyrivibrio sp.]
MWDMKKTKKTDYLMHGLSKRTDKLSDVSKPLTSEEWGGIYNPENIAGIVESLTEGRISFQIREMLKLSHEGDRVLEIGSGSGATSCYLAKNGRIVTALDFSENALKCVRGVAEKMDISIETVLADATVELPFAENQFDIIFQAGLLEHFEQEMRIKLLKNWGK